MKVLLLHPRDNVRPRKVGQWDLVIDLGRAATSVYETWSRRTNCPVIGMHDFAEEMGDLRRVTDLLHLGMNSLEDQWHNDWWGMLSVEIVPELHQLILIHRLSRYINQECEIYSSRSDYRSVALHSVLGGRLINLEGSLQTAARRFRHYSQVATNFNTSQIFQMAQDKFDREHVIRRRFGRRDASSSGPTILLPSAYTSVSRMALTYANLLPDEQFLLVCTRDNAKVRELPANVQMKSLDPYFSAPDSGEISSLLERWETLRAKLIASAPEYESGAAIGLFDRIPSLLRWGTTIRDAWQRLFESENIRSCFCADHSNPYTRIPLLLAKHAGVPAVACHHGALDAWMAITTHDADFYVAKSEMERDYMTRVCGIPMGKVLHVAPPHSVESFPRSGDSESALGLDLPNKRWLVFFSEPYSAWSWRVDEVYRELLPGLCALAETSGLKLVFKLHPFETERGYRNLLQRLLPAEKVRKIQIITGPIPEQLWSNARIGLTVQSSVAWECAARGIPIFLCGWLRDSFTGYARQYEKFGVGHVLERPAQISDIPQLLKREPLHFRARQNPPDPVVAETLRELLLGLVPVPTAAKG